MENFKNNVKKNLWIFYITGIFVITIIFNCKGFILNTNSSILNIFISLIYLIGWFYLMKQLNKSIYFSKIASIFWLLTSMVTALYYFLYTISYTGETFAPIALIFLSPIYSVGEMLAPYSISKIYITMIISFIMLFFNYKNLMNLEKDSLSDND